MNSAYFFAKVNQRKRKKQLLALKRGVSLSLTPIACLSMQWITISPYLVENKGKI
jgi:hypothetical protein